MMAPLWRLPPDRQPGAGTTDIRRAPPQVRPLLRCRRDQRLGGVRACISSSRQMSNTELRRIGTVPCLPHGTLSHKGDVTGAGQQTCRPKLVAHKTTPRSFRIATPVPRGEWAVKSDLFGEVVIVETLPHPMVAPRRRAAHLTLGAAGRIPADLRFKICKIDELVGLAA